MVQLQKDLAELRNVKIQVVGISYDDRDVLEKFSTKQKITFPLLSDKDSTTIKAFGLLNTEAAEQIAGVPYPGTVIVDKSGVIRAKLFLDGYRDRHPTQDLVQAVKTLP